jgi:hypothetical protein
MDETSIVVLGGCHVNGYRVGQGQAFTTLLPELTAGRVLRQVACVSFSKLPLYLGVVDELNPTHVVLQLGNFEFSNSLRHLLKLANLPLLSEAKQAQVASEESKSASLSTRPSQNWGRTAGLSLLLLLLWYSRRLHPRNLRALQACMRSHPQVVFLMVTPLPSLDPTLNTIRRLGGWLLRQRVAAPNCHWVCSHQLLQPAGPLFIDPAHLNARGHQVLAYGLAEVLANTVTRHPRQAVASIFAV